MALWGSEAARAGKTDGALIGGVLQVVQAVQDVQAVRIGRTLKSAVFEVQDSNSGDENDCAEKNHDNN